MGSGGRFSLEAKWTWEGAFAEVTLLGRNWGCIRTSNVWCAAMFLPVRSGGFIRL